MAPMSCAGDADVIAAPPDASLQYVPRAQLPPDLPDIDRLALELEGGIARDDDELGEPGQLGCDVLGHAVAEIVLLRVAAEIGEWEGGGRPILLPTLPRVRGRVGSGRAGIEAANGAPNEPVR